MIYNRAVAAAVNPLLQKEFFDFDFNSYIEAPGISSHGLMDIRITPEYFKWRKENDKPTQAKDFGRAVHLLVLEPEKAEKQIKKGPDCDRRSNANKLIHSEFEASCGPQDVILDKEDFEAVKHIKKKLLNHSFARDLVDPARRSKAGRILTEQTAFVLINFGEGEKKIQIVGKFRPDVLFLDSDWMVDIKTTRSAQYKNFQRDIVNFNYDLQCAWYRDLYRLKTGRALKGFLWLTVENVPPYGIAVYAAETAVMDHGRFKYNTALSTYVQCLQTNKWPSYPEQAVPMELPGWAVYQEQEG